MLEEKIKKAELSIFFLVGPVSSTSEDSSTVEYSECGLIKFIFYVSDKMSGRHSVLCRTFWFPGNPAGHFATWKCLATFDFVFFAGHFLRIDHCQTRSFWKCPARQQCCKYHSSRHFKIMPDMSGIFDNHCQFKMTFLNMLTVVVDCSYYVVMSKSDWEGLRTQVHEHCYYYIIQSPQPSPSP